MVNNAVGPGSIEEDVVAPKPLLEGASEYEYVEILNPLPVDFVGLFTVTRPVRASVTISNSPDAPGVTQTEDDVRRNYGLNLNNPDYVGKTHIQNRVTIKAGETLRIIGSEAQVVIRQLVNEIMQRDKKSLMMSDPYQRSLVEKRIVISRSTINDLLGAAPVTIAEQTRAAVDKSNEFPEMERDDASDIAGNGNTGDAGSGETDRGETLQSERRSPGRPKKT